MVNLESALTDGTCPDAQPKQYVFYAPPSAVTRLPGRRRHPHHRGQQPRRGLRPAGPADGADTPGRRRGYTILGIGQNAAQAFTPYTTTIHGRAHRHHRRHPGHRLRPADRVDGDRHPARPGVGLRRERPRRRRRGGAQDRRHGDRLPALGHRARCLPQPAAGAAGPGCWCRPAPTSSWARTRTSCSAAGYLGSAYVDYGLGNFAFYDNSPPENASGSLVITATGRHIDQVTWRPAVIVDDLPQPLSGDAATAGAGGVEPGPVLHQRHRRRPALRWPRRETETAPAPASAAADALGRLGLTSPRPSPAQRTQRGEPARQGP